MNDRDDADISQSKLSQLEYSLCFQSLMPKMEKQRIL